MSRAIDGMLDDFFEIYEQGKLDPEFVFITHSIAPKYASYIREKVEERVKIEHLIESSAGSVISTHCGAGTIGILYLEK
ncbi:MAG: DegV family protein [Acholeplasmataceae bacterium]|nr:DegV family protein [Acholeplasmataceae bacterium]